MSLTVQYCSDLHLEFSKNAKYLKKNPIEAKADVLLLAGDIVPFDILDRYEAFFDDLAQRWQQVYWIPGNHEYYNADVAERTGSFTEQVRPNITLLNNQVLEVGAFRFIFSTLWTHLGPLNEGPIRQRLSDFHTVKKDGNPLLPAHYNAMHQECLDFVSQALTQKVPGKANVVVSHHVPTFQNYPPQFKGSLLTEAFAVNLDGLMESQGPDYWIYGHHHCYNAPFAIGPTQLLTNQLGYVQLGEHYEFRPWAILPG